MPDFGLLYEIVLKEKEREAALSQCEYQLRTIQGVEIEQLREMHALDSAHVKELRQANIEKDKGNTIILFQ